MTNKQFLAEPTIWSAFYAPCHILPQLIHLFHCYPSIFQPLSSTSLSNHIGSVVSIPSGGRILVDALLHGTQDMGCSYRASPSSCFSKSHLLTWTTCLKSLFFSGNKKKKKRSNNHQNNWKAENKEKSLREGKAHHVKWKCMHMESSILRWEHTKVGHYTLRIISGELKHAKQIKLSANLWVYRYKWHRQRAGTAELAGRERPPFLVPS